MRTSSPPLRPLMIATRVFLLGLGLAFAPRLFPASTPGNVIEGRIFNADQKEYLRDAEVRLEGSDQVVASGSGGVYRLTNVPAGEVTVTVTYTGLLSSRAVVNVIPGQTSTKDFALSRASPAGTDADSPIMLAGLVVSSAREGDAKAIMSQRNSMNITNSVASDVFGNNAEGNVGEFLKNLPGVELNLVEGEARSVRLRGLGPEYTSVTLDGISLASADAQGAANDSRAFSFEQVSLSSMDSIEVSKTISADVDANAPAGTINLKSKRAFDRPGRRITWQANSTLYSEEFHLDRTFGPADEKMRKILPGGILEYSDVFLDNRLGVVLNISESNLYSANSKSIMTWNFTPTAADPRPAVLTGLNMIHGPRTNERFTTTLTTDFKASPHLTLSFGFIYNYANLWFAQRGTIFNTGARTSVVGTNPLVGFATSGGAGSAVVSNTGVAKLGKTLTYIPRVEYKKGDLEVEAKFAYSKSDSWYSPMNRRGVPFNLGNNTLGGINFSATRSSALDADWHITQVSGPDASNGVNYTSPAITIDDGRISTAQVYSGEVNATLMTRAIWPVTWKAGLKHKGEIRDFDLKRDSYIYNYTGPGAKATGGWADYRSPYDLDYSMLGASANTGSGSGFFMPNLTEVGRLYREHPGYFTQALTATNYYNAFIANKKHYVEDINAAFLMGTTDLGKVRVRAGLRWEDTGTDSLEFDPRTPAETAAAGYATSGGRATTIPGLQYQYFSKPRIHRTGDYDYFFPSGSAKYNLTRNLSAHVGYSRTIRRPAFNNIAGVWVINDETQTVNAPNTALKPELSDNLSARVAYYFEPVGILGINLFQNNVKGLHTTTRQTAEEFGYTGDPQLATYTFITTGNSIANTQIRGLELEYSQALSFLPGPLKGLSLRGSYARNYAGTTVANLVPRSSSAGLSYSAWRFNLNANLKWDDSYSLDSVGTLSTRHRTTVDGGGGFRISDRTSFFFTVRNLFNTPLRQMQQVGANPAVMSRYEISGTSWTFGVKGTF